MRALLLVSLGALLLVGCGDGGSEATDAGNPSDQCANDADVAILSVYVVDGGVGQSAALNDILRGCAQGVCSAQIVGGTPAEANACMNTCFQTTELTGLSDGCGDCWTEGIICTRDHCAAVCLGTDEQLCADCVLENCVPQRSWCTGL